jgi:hypothetical protein
MNHTSKPKPDIQAGTNNTGTPASAPPLMQDTALMRKIGRTTYILTAKYNKESKEGLVDKLWRLIKNDAS